MEKILFIKSVTIGGERHELLKAEEKSFGRHNVDAGHQVSFKAGKFNGKGKVVSTGKDGCTVADETGREHTVNWHEVEQNHSGESKMTKAHVAGYTKKDGTYVKDHDDSRQGKADLEAQRKSWSRDSGRTMGQHIAAMSKDHAERSRFHDADHDSEIAYTTGSERDHGVAYRSHKSAAAQSSTPGIRAYHEEMASDHEDRAGSYENAEYGVHFKKGDKVKDRHGNSHTVIHHRGAEVLTESGDRFHPTKLSKA